MVVYTCLRKGGEREEERDVIEREREREITINAIPIPSTQVLLAMTLLYLLLAWIALTLRQSHIIPRLKKAIVTKW